MAKPVLVAPGSGAGFVGELAVPAELYWVSLEPTPLAGMGYPARADWGLLHRAGLRHVVCLTHDDGVVVHCRGGRGRTGAVLGCALVRLGHDPSEVVTYLDALHRWRGKHGWPESPWQARIVEACATG